MKKVFLIFLLGLFLISLVSSSISDIGSFKRGDCIDLPQSCSDCTYNNISKITNANSVVVLTETIMQKDGTYYSYNFCNTTTLGQYKVNGFGDESGVKSTWEYTFSVTETGEGDKSFFNNALLIILISLALIFLIMGIKTEIIWFGFMSAVMFLLGGIYLTIYGLNDLTNMYTQGAGVTIIGIGIIILFVSVYEGFLDN